MMAMDETLSAFSKRLNGEGPLGVAVSGGGDSVALLYLLKAWGRRPLHVFCVDHGLNPYSVLWTQTVKTHAVTVGAAFTALKWEGAKPCTGISAAARTARHRLLANAARKAGIHALCLAHTADDISEAVQMRAQGSTVGMPSAWTPSPAWPEGRGVFLYRPLLNVRRADLRDYLRDQGINWIEDPANSNPMSLRARVRMAGNADVPETQEAPPLPEDGFTLHPLGRITLHRQSLPPDQRLRALAMAVVSAGGGVKLPRADSVKRLLDRDGVLCGARVRHDGADIQVVREPGEMRRAGAAWLEVGPGETMWDGRFAITATEKGMVMPPIIRQLSRPDREHLRHLPVELRPVVPVLYVGQAVILPGDAPPALPGAYQTCWVPYRFLAAAGRLMDEQLVCATVRGMARDLQHSAGRTEM